MICYLIVALTTAGWDSKLVQQVGNGLQNNKKKPKTLNCVYPFTQRNSLLEICAKEIWMCSQLCIRMFVAAYIGGKLEAPYVEV